MANPDCDRNLRPWESAHGQSFSEAFTDWLLQLSVRSYNEPQRRIIWHNTIGLTQTTRSKWHFPAHPYVGETDENAARLLPTFSYDFAKRGDRWIFYNFRFRATWKCDPETGNIVVPTLSAWSNIVDTLPHYRQAHGWPILPSPCYEGLYDKYICTWHLYPDAPRHRDIGKQRNVLTTVNPQSQVSESSPTRSATTSILSSPDSDSDILPRCVRFLVSSPDASRVRFLLSSPRASCDGPSSSPPSPAQRHWRDLAWRVPRLVTRVSTPAAISPPEIVRLNVSTSTARTRTNIVSAITSLGVSTTTTVTTTTTTTTTTRVEAARSSTTYLQAEALVSPPNRSESTISSRTGSESTSISSSSSSASISSSSSLAASSPPHAPGNPYSYDSDPDNYDWPSDSESDSEDYDENADAHSTGSWSENHVSLFNHSADDESQVLDWDDDERASQW
ncbi:hypothetical protein G647_08384 [Cladophialophora carrionii CBS 160.54]|uniref:Uncharacterized protein n=1 Tax=Cladophialophora carrionii CBS 160.54 TaxID=1279043 RepID=V9D0D2_9EURO|nr:uncharacterized protein G647_08384 [Cladophialophora carrionii CBS 160.54]ETI20350.1 hypothetical protein G647_08384 [Cladophialophora carrionii CBS 160.54]